MTRDCATPACRDHHQPVPRAVALARERWEARAQRRAGVMEAQMTAAKRDLPSPPTRDEP